VVAVVAVSTVAAMAGVRVVTTMPVVLAVLVATTVPAGVSIRLFLDVGAVAVVLAMRAVTVMPVVGGHTFSSDCDTPGQYHDRRLAPPPRGR
jgi:hypothetical protein